MIKNYFKIALRNLLKHKLFTVINVIGLSIGISAALVIYLIVHFDFTFDKFHKDGDRIYHVVSKFTFSGEASYNSGVCGPLPEAARTQVTGIQLSAPFFTFSFGVQIPKGGKAYDKFKNEDVILADNRYIDLFGYKWLSGTPKSALSGPNQVVLTSDQAKIYFPSLSYDQMIGKVIIYEDTIKTAVTGIVQSFKENTDINFHDIVSLNTGKALKSLSDQMGLQMWGGTNSSSQFFVKLNAGVAPAGIEHQLDNLLKKNNPPRAEDKGNTNAFVLLPLSDLHFNEQYGNFDNGRVASKTTLYGLLVIGAFLLVLGCINFINLSTAQASQRSKEIGIRKTLGSSRSQIIIQFLNETFLITLAAVLIGVILTPLILKLFADFIPKGIKADFLQPNIIIFLILLLLLVSLLAGFYPARVLSGYKPVLVMKNQAYANTGKTRNAWLRKSLTVTQFVIAQFFIMATLLVSKQIYYALHKDLGFKKDAILFVYTPWKVSDPNREKVFFNKVRALPQVELTSISGAPPSSNGTSSTTMKYLDGKKEIKTDVQVKDADENYLVVYQLKLLGGRNLRNADSAKTMLINATYARILGFSHPADAVGKNIRYNDKDIRIVGVIGDFYQKSLRTAIKPMSIKLGKNNGTLHIALKPQTAGGNEWKTAIAGIQKAWKESYPEEDFEYNFYDESIAKFYESEQHTSTLLSWATGLSILISCLGLLGLAIYTTGQRTKEIGVRKVLGASVAQIVALLSTELMWLVILAFVLVTPIAWYAMNKWMENFADRTTISWWIFALSGAGMLLTAMITLSFQTIRAATTNPVNSLKSE